MKRPVRLEEIINDDLYAPLIHAGEIESLLKEFPAAGLYQANLDFSDSYFEYWEDILKKRKDRRGEVVFAIARDHKLLVHTKSYYPDLALRLLTGGIDHDEKVLVALNREVYEETGMQIITRELVSIIFYRFKNGSKSLSFASYIFYLTPDHENPVVQDPNEDISEFRWIDLQGLSEIMTGLTRVPSEWQDWARMRLVAHQDIREYLTNRTQKSQPNLSPM